MQRSETRILTTHAASLPRPCADDQLVIAGVIDTQANYAEHPEVVADRIERVAGAIGGGEWTSAPCGFASLRLTILRKS